MDSSTEADEVSLKTEQLKLLLGNMSSMVIPVTAVASMLVLTLSNPRNVGALELWLVAKVSVVSYGFLHARHLLQQDRLDNTPLPPLVRSLILQHASNGLLWGILAWLTLNTTTPAGSILVVSVITGIVGGALSTLSPVLPVFVSFAVTALGVTGLKLWSMGNPEYRVLGLSGLFYITALLVQARNSSQATRSAILLRFKNLELIQKLKIESEAAHSAQQLAEDANIAKSRFLAAASHDLRQPIHAQGLFLDVLARTALTGQQRDLIHNSTCANEASAQMLNTLLDFSRIEAGVIRPKIKPVYLQPLLNKIEKEFASQADAKGLNYRSRESSLSALTDAGLLELILRNLVSNAIRYTKKGGVLVAFRKKGDQILLEVWDTGIGIDPDQHEVIFQEFHQLGNPERDRQKGLGLGLAIVEGLVALLNHKISLCSIPGRGSIFRVSLATAPTLAQEPDLENSPDRITPMHVLVIDDDEVVRVSMACLLKDWGCTTAIVESLDQASAAALDRLPDLIISDYRLREKLTGADAIQAIRQQTGKPALPALLITGDTAPERLREAHESGIPLEHKPVLPAKLYQVLLHFQHEIKRSQPE